MKNRMPQTRLLSVYDIAPSLTYRNVSVSIDRFEGHAWCSDRTRMADSVGKVVEAAHLTPNFLNGRNNNEEPQPTRGWML